MLNSYRSGNPFSYPFAALRKGCNLGFALDSIVFAVQSAREIDLITCRRVKTAPKAIVQIASNGILNLLP